MYAVLWVPPIYKFWCLYKTFYIYLFHFRIYTLIQSLFGFPANGKQFTKIDKPLNFCNVLPLNTGPIIPIPSILYADKTWVMGGVASQYIFSDNITTEKYMRQLSHGDFGIVWMMSSVLYLT